jgi:hypothetical protein
LGRGIAVVTDRHGKNEVFRFDGLAIGAAGGSRFVKNVDTPTGIYTISKIERGFLPQIQTALHRTGKDELFTR